LNGDSFLEKLELAALHCSPPNLFWSAWTLACCMSWMTGVNVFLNNLPEAIAAISYSNGF